MKQEYYDKLMYQIIGQCLREERMKRKMSLRQLSEATGGKKDKSTLQRYEKGTFRFTDTAIREICSAMNLDYDEFMLTAGRRIYNTLKEDEDWLNSEHYISTFYDEDAHLTKVMTAYQVAPPHIQKAIDSLLQIE